MLPCRFAPEAIEPLLARLTKDQAATAILARIEIDDDIEIDDADSPNLGLFKDGDNSLKIAYDTEIKSIAKTQKNDLKALRPLINALQKMENHFDVISQNVDETIMQYLLDQNYIAEPSTLANNSNLSTIQQSEAPNGFFSANAAQENVTKKSRITKDDKDEVESAADDAELEQKKRKIAPDHEDNYLPTKFS